MLGWHDGKLWGCERSDLGYMGNLHGSNEPHPHYLGGEAPKYWICGEALPSSSRLLIAFHAALANNHVVFAPRGEQSTATLAEVAVVSLEHSAHPAFG